jgi:hypothetical protein
LNELRQVPIARLDRVFVDMAQIGKVIAHRSLARGLARFGRQGR